MSNWIPDVNRFTLPTPPSFWLRALHDFDPSLVVIPSKQQAVYRLAQRRKVNLPEKMLKDPFFQESDTQMMASYGLIPVTSILPTINWSDPENFQELARRAPWRQGGADEVSRQIEAREAKEALDKQLYIDDVLQQQSKDAWGLYNKKIGVRSHMYIPRTRGEIVSSKTPSIRVK